ncbi:biotin--[acetyl-CoA-carboxylase] ligase [Pacificimonas sp. WHA3]|uniref:biotin--[biotin carboxyl-carrier protein] ligase n=1 Tax=Pacificimonas pallii TaxID=2827236 RepID=A0ABS6SE74_9SPHN|nr:biotin--[acetyl-CoA-carboxylase] ligase [Pacificimonas pallii]MBV7256684.1 biotin--[acetyl-CoA-carboxylase] ligase [Pacificimonas pallii]
MTAPVTPPDIVHLAEVGSTNDWIAAAAARGDPDGLWVQADIQTAGRGRRGRHWTSEGGNLFASTLVRPAAGEPPPQQLSFVAALALYDTARAYIASERLSLKWPNDLMLDGIKCAGILVEGRDGCIIIGIGVNLSHHPEGTERPATSWPARGVLAPPTREVANGLARTFAARRRQWRETGFAATRTDWLKQAHALGQQIEARIGDETHVGIFETISDDGALILNQGEAGRRLIHAGEVFGL